MGGGVPGAPPGEVGAGDAVRAAERAGSTGAATGAGDAVREGGCRDALLSGTELEAADVENTSASTVVTGGATASVAGGGATAGAIGGAELGMAGATDRGAAETEGGTSLGMDGTTEGISGTTMACMGSVGGSWLGVKNAGDSTMGVEGAALLASFMAISGANSGRDADGGSAGGTGVTARDFRFSLRWGRRGVGLDSLTRGEGEAGVLGILLARAIRGGVVGKSLSSVGVGVDPFVALRLTWLTCATPAEIALDALPQNPPIFDFRTGSGGFAPSTTFSTCLSPVPGSTLATRLLTVLSREVARLGTGACMSSGIGSSHTRSTRAARTNAHKEQVVRSRARHQPEAQRGYMDLLVVLALVEGCVAVMRKMNTCVGNGRS
jgi:hypothetical protein